MKKSKENKVTRWFKIVGTDFSKKRSHDGMTIEDVTYNLRRPIFASDNIDKAFTEWQRLVEEGYKDHMILVADFGLSDGFIDELKNGINNPYSFGGPITVAEYNKGQEQKEFYISSLSVYLGKEIQTPKDDQSNLGVLKLYCDLCRSAEASKDVELVNTEKISESASDRTHKRIRKIATRTALKQQLKGRVGFTSQKSLYRGTFLEEPDPALFEG